MTDISLYEELLYPFDNEAAKGVGTKTQPKYGTDPPASDSRLPNQENEVPETLKEASTANADDLSPTT